MILMPSVKRETHIHSKQVPLLMENGSVGSEMDSDVKNGQMVLNTKDNGKIIEPMAKENSFISTVISMMESG